MVNTRSKQPPTGAKISRSLRSKENILCETEETPTKSKKQERISNKENQKTSSKNESKTTIDHQVESGELKMRIRRSFLAKSSGETELKMTSPTTHKRKSVLTPSDKRKPKLKMIIRRSAVRRGMKASQVQGSESETFSEDEGDFSENNEFSEEIMPLKGRETEFLSIDNWIRKSVTNKESLTIYISGSPGTGKTATLRLVLQKWNDDANSTIINCVSVKNQKDLIQAIFLSQNHDERATQANFQGFIKQLRRPLIVVLDEIDHLSNTSNTLLYTAFNWPQQFTSNLIIIGIANSIDLTERLLPKLKLCQAPKSLVFTPYTKEKIKEILEEKMKKEESNMNEKAVELCARKVAAMSGDLRTALHVFKTTKSATSASSGSASNGCREVLSVLNTVYSSPLARARLPMQPSLLLAVCLCMSSNKKTNLTTNTIISGYVKACDAIKVPPLENDDLSAAFQTLESQAFISTSTNGQIRLQVDSKTARNVISDNAMIEQISILNL